QLGKRLKLEASTVSWRVRRVMRGGWLKNLETRNGHPARLTLGDPLPDETTALPTVEQVHEVFESLRRPFESAAQPTNPSERSTSSDPFECENGFRETVEGTVDGPLDTPEDEEWLDL